MSGLQSPQPQNAPGNSPAVEAGGPQLRVVAADPDNSPSPLEQFDSSLAGGDLSRARDALLIFRDEQRAERDRLEQEKTQLVQAVADLQQLLDDRCQAHEDELQQQKEQLARWHEQEKQALATEAEQAMAEIQSAQDGFAEECQQWEADRDEQTAQLADERARLESDTADLADRRTEFEAAIAKEQQERLRMTDELIAQRESEWAERQKQLEHELKSQRQLHEKQITLDRESFLQACSDREAELNGIRAELDRERQELVEDRCKTAERFAETRRQLEQDRSLVQDGLRKMEAQLHWVSSSISLSAGSPPAAVAPQPEPAPEPIATDESVSPVITDPGMATSDSFVAAESADSAEPQSGWAGLVTPRDDEPAFADDSKAAIAEEEMPTEAVSDEASAPEGPPEEASEKDRRARIEDYRSQLASLQASLGNLQSESDEAAQPS